VCDRHGLVDIHGAAVLRARHRQRVEEFGKATAILGQVDRKAVLRAEPIKTLGMFTIKVQLHKDVEARVKLWVISDESK
jgi:ribosomal protein L9